MEEIKRAGFEYWKAQPLPLEEEMCGTVFRPNRIYSNIPEMKAILETYGNIMVVNQNNCHVLWAMPISLVVLATILVVAYAEYRHGWIRGDK